jgi:hypothetical protein
VWCATLLSPNNNDKHLHGQCDWYHLIVSKDDYESLIIEEFASIVFNEAIAFPGR